KGTQNAHQILRFIAAHDRGGAEKSQRGLYRIHGPERKMFAAFGLFRRIQSEGGAAAAISAQSLGDPVDQAVTQGAIGVELLLAVAADDAWVRRRPIFDVGGQGAREVERL